MKRIMFVLATCFAFSLSLSAQEYKYKVIDTQISREEFLEAYRHRHEYNQVRDTSLTWFTKKNVEVAVFWTLPDEEKNSYLWTDYVITNIGQYPTGEYVADLWHCNWMGAVFLDEEFQVDSTVINGSDRAVYSNNGVYVGCRGFDCDDIAWFSFYGHKDGNLAKMEEIAEYVNNKWSLSYGEKYPEFDGLDATNAMVWYNDALYCFGIENYDDENGKWRHRPIFMKLELIPVN